jgi:hypothetical protein
MPSPTSELSDLLKEWLQDNVPRFLINVSEKVGLANPWEMPVIDDFILIVAVNDFKDGNGVVLSVASNESPSYRIRGLITEALQ